MQRLVLFFALLVAAVLASSTCEQKITEAKLFINGEAQAKKCPHFVTNMMLSSFGVKRFSHAGVVLDIFNRPKANLLVIKDQTANDCAMNYDVKKMLNKYYARFASEQPFVVSMALSQADAERPVLLALTNNNVFSIYQDVHTFNFLIPFFLAILPCQQQEATNCSSSRIWTRNYDFRIKRCFCLEIRTR